MALISLKAEASGDFKNIRKFAKTIDTGAPFRDLDYYGRLGVDALSRATPVDTGLTAVSWSYSFEEKPGHLKIAWYNSHVERGANIAVLLQYGHGTNHGGYVHGRDYINPAIRPVFDRILNEVWKKVTNA